jgi:16S rRNA (uracil1498-N3)-methyltransferase
MATIPRLHVMADLQQDAVVALPAEQTHYLLSVLRLEPEAAVLVFNGRQGEWLGKLERSGKKAAALRIVESTRAQPKAADLWLVFAPLKSARLDYLVQKAAEMGASRLVPVFTERTQAQRFNGERADANLIEAAEQCNILTVPARMAEQKLAPLLQGWPKERRLIFCDEDAPLANPLHVLAGLPQSEPLAVAIGPEGGFSPAERAMLLALPKVTRLSLGPRILRADTAAVAAMAILQASLGDWRG